MYADFDFNRRDIAAEVCEWFFKFIRHDNLTERGSFLFKAY